MMGSGRSDHSSMNRTAVSEKNSTTMPPAEHDEPLASSVPAAGDSKRSNKWPTAQQTAEKKVARIALVNHSLMQGRDPYEDLKAHDAALEDLPTAQRNKKRICNPTYNERTGGANINTVAANRVGTTLESVEVQTTMRYLLNHADQLDLGKNTLNGLNYIIKNFCEYHANPAAWDPKPADADDDWVPTRPIPSEKSFNNASKTVMTFYKDAREYHIKTAQLKLGGNGDDEINLDDPAAMANILNDINSRVSEIVNVLNSSDKAIEMEATVIDE